MRDTCIEHELICPVLKFICLPAELVIKHEIVIRPLQTLSKTRRKSIHSFQWLDPKDGYLVTKEDQLELLKFYFAPELI